MTEIQPYTPAPEPVREHGAGLATLRETAAALRDAHTMAQALVQTAFVPPQFKGRPQEAAAAMLAGAEVGLSPLAALRAFDVIQGVAAPRAIALRAVAQSRGHEVWVEDASDQRAVVCGRRRGSQQVERVTWSMDRARRAGLAGKGTWAQHPEAMLVARATAEVCRRIASDALLGIGYAAEELDVEPPPTVRVAREPRPVTARRAPVAAAPEPPEPDLDEPTPPPADPDPEHGVTDAQMRRLGVALRDAGLSERADALAYVGRVIGRDIASRKELTMREASLVIDALVSPEDPEGEEPPVESMAGAS